MRSKSRHVQLHPTGWYVIPLMSYINIFYEGKTSLHPGFYCGKLFALSSKVWAMNKRVAVKSCQIKSRHLKPKKVSYIIQAPNTSAEVYSGVTAGVLYLKPKQYQKLLRLGADPQFFIHQPIHNMFKKEGEQNLFVGTYKQWNELFSDHTEALALPAKGYAADGKTPSEEVADRFALAQAWAKDYAAGNTEPYADVLSHVEGFLAGSQIAFETAVGYAASTLVEAWGGQTFDETLTDPAAAREWVSDLLQSQEEVEEGYPSITMTIEDVALNAEAIATRLGVKVPEASAEDVQKALEQAQENTVKAAVPAVDEATEGGQDEGAAEDDDQTPAEDAEAEHEDAIPATDLPATPTVSDLPAFNPQTHTVVPRTVLNAAANVAKAAGELLNELASAPVDAA